MYGRKSVCFTPILHTSLPLGCFGVVNTAVAMQPQQVNANTSGIMMKCNAMFLGLNNSSDKCMHMQG